METLVSNYNTFDVDSIISNFDVKNIFSNKKDNVVAAVKVDVHQNGIKKLKELSKQLDLVIKTLPNEKININTEKKHLKLLSPCLSLFLSLKEELLGIQNFFDKVTITPIAKEAISCIDNCIAKLEYALDYLELAIEVQTNKNKLAKQSVIYSCDEFFAALS